MPCIFMCLINAKNDVERMKADIRQRAVNTVERPLQIILQSTSAATLEASHLIPRRSAQFRENKAPQFTFLATALVVGAQMSARF